MYYTTYLEVSPRTRAEMKEARRLLFASAGMMNYAYSAEVAEINKAVMH